MWVNTWLQWLQSSDKHKLVANGKNVRFAPGNCNSRNILYLVTCKFCHKIYVGESVQKMSKRFTDHRHCVYQILRNAEIDFESDAFVL